MIGTNSIKKKAKGEMNQPVSVPYQKKVRGKEGRVLVENFEWSGWVTVRDKRIWVNVVVPAGFFYDGASIPSLIGLLWRIIGHPLDPEFEAAAVVHDYLYSDLNKKIGPDVSREVADIIFLTILFENGVGETKRGIMYQAVRKFGWMGYGSPAVIIPEYTK